MKLSQKRRDAVYAAIHGAVMDCRIALNRDGLSAKHDAMIAQAETDIWKRIKAALKLED